MIATEDTEITEDTVHTEDTEDTEDTGTELILSPYTAPRAVAGDRMCLSLYTTPPSFRRMPESSGKTILINKDSYLTGFRSLPYNMPGHALPA